MKPLQLPVHLERICGRTSVFGAGPCAVGSDVPGRLREAQARKPAGHSRMAVEPGSLPG